jgi:hypothetical protein
VKLFKLYGKAVKVKYFQPQTVNEVKRMPQVKKTSINIDASLWKEWLLFVVEKYGTSRKVSVALADAISRIYGKV